MPSPQVSLTVQQPNQPDRSVEMEGTELRIGRSEDCELCLADVSISRRHARLLIQGDRVVFEDTGSGNGSYFQGVRIERHELADGDELFIEPFTLRIHIHDLDGEPEATAWIPDESGGEDTLPMKGDNAAWLEPVNGQGLEARYDIPVTGLTLGRSEQRDVVLLDQSASRLHCEIVVTGAGHLLRDPGSANGTAVNGKVVKERPLRHGDVIQVGTTQLRFLKMEAVDASTQMMPGEAPERTESFGQVLSGRPAASPSRIPNLAPPRAPNLAEASFPPTGPSIHRAPTVAQRPLAPQATPQAAPQPAAPPRPAPSRSSQQVAPPRPAPKRAARPVVPPSGPTVDQQPPLHGGQPPHDGASTVAWSEAQVQAARQASAPQAPSSPAASPLSSGGGFGAPPPNLGDLPQDGGFGGGVELQIDPDAAKGGRRLRSGGGRRKASGGGFLSKRINQATVGILGLILLMVGFKVVRDADLGGGVELTERAPVSEASDALDPLDAEEVRRQMDEGVQLFQTGRYYEATSRFLSVLKLDPGHEGAERMGYVACEFIAVRELQEAVESSAASEADRAQARQDALDAAEQALSGRGSLSSANEALRSALKLNPDDAELSAAQRKVRGRLAAVVQRAETEKSEALEGELVELYARGRAQLDRGAWTQSLATFNEVLKSDPDRSSSVYYKAEEGIKEAKDAMRGQADAPYRRGVAAMDGGDCITARRELSEALRLDPYHSSAKGKRDECQRKLEAQASDKFKEARVLESANQIERALSSYQQVLTLVGDKNSSLYQKAQARINDIMQ